MTALLRNTHTEKKEKDTISMSIFHPAHVCVLFYVPVQYPAHVCVCVLADVCVSTSTSTTGSDKTIA